MVDGVLGDAEHLKFDPETETLENIQERYVFLKRQSGLPTGLRLKIISRIYGSDLEKLTAYIENYVLNMYTERTRERVVKWTFDRKFDVFWKGIIGGELKDWKHLKRYGPEMVRERWKNGR